MYLLHVELQLFFRMISFPSICCLTLLNWNSFRVWNDWATKKISLIVFKIVILNFALLLTESRVVVGEDHSNSWNSNRTGLYKQSFWKSLLWEHWTTICRRPRRNIDFEAFAFKVFWVELLNPSYLFLITFRPIFVAPHCVHVSVCVLTRLSFVLFKFFWIIWSLFEAFCIQTARVESLCSKFLNIESLGAARGWFLLCRENKREVNWHGRNLWSWFPF